MSITPVGESVRRLDTLAVATMDGVLSRNPALSIAVGIVMLAISFVVPGTTRDLILRVAGVLALLAGAGMWLASRRG